MRYWVILAAAAALAGWVLDLLHVPVAWLLGPMFAGIGLSAWLKRPFPMPPYLLAIGQALVGLGIGVGFTLETLQRVAFLGLPLAVGVVITGGLSLLNGRLLWRWAGIDPATGFLGSLPGAAPAMVAMSSELGADPVAVALLQYVRLLLVVLLTPPAVHLLFPAAAAGGSAAAATLSGLPAAPAGLNLTVLLLCGLAGAYLGRRLHFPSAFFLGPVLAVMPVSWMFPYQFVLPSGLFSLGMGLVGLSIGLRFDLSTALRLGKAVAIEVALVVVLIILCLGVGYGFHLMTGVDTMTAVLGSTPGGMDVMVATAAKVDADPGLVLAMQMTRWLIVLLAGPWVTARLVPRSGQAYSGLGSPSVQGCETD